jgi:fibronectin type 3 domain-containing protein
VHTQFSDVDPTSTTAQLADGAWELAVPNGTYSVLATVGDQMGATSYDSQHTVLAEGTPVISAFQAAAAREYEQAGAQVAVSDGRLTISPGNGFNTKLAFVEVRAVEVADTTPPAAPAGLAATEVSGGVALTWSSNTEADVAGYRVYRGTGETVAATGTPISGDVLLADARFTDDSVEPGTRYSYVVVAVDRDDNASTASAPASITTAPPADTTAPAAPAGLEVVAAEGTVQLSWTENAEPDLAGYRVYRDTDEDVDTGGAPISGDDLLSEAAFTDAEVQPGTAYSYVVQAVDDAGNASGSSAPAGVRTPEPPDTTAPAAPTALAASEADGDVALTWAENNESDLAGYRVYRGDGQSADTSGAPLTGAVLLSRPAFTDNSAQAGTTYTYLVVAVDDSNNASGPSAPARITTAPPVDTTAPAAPTELAADEVDGDVVLTWVENTELDLAGYRVHRGTGDSVATTGTPLSGAALLTDPAFTDTTAEAGATYSYVVVAVDSAGNASSASAATTITLPAPPPPPVTCTDTQYRAEYFAGTDLAGDPVAVRCEAAIDNDWGTGTPAGVDGLDADAFSVRWTQSRVFVAGTYDFTVEADDGIRTFVDGAQVLEDWSRHGPRVRTAQQTLTAGRHEIVVEYFEAGGGAVARAGYVIAPVVDPGPTCTAAQWQAQYFDGRSLAGAPAAVRCEDGIDVDFGAGGPAGVEAVGVDDFSVRWSTERTLAAGTYQLTATADDGIRVLVDGQQVLDGFRDQGPTTYDAEIVLAEGQHRVVVEYYEAGGGALARFGMSRQPDEVVCPAGDFRAEYFNGTALDGVPVAIRCERAVDYDFGGGAPQSVPVAADSFSVRWTRVAELAAGTYAYSATADDGVRVLVDGSAVIDEWRDQGPTTFTGERTLDAGQHTLVVEYYEAGGGALVRATERRVPGAVVCAPGEYRAEYYDGRTLEGTPLAVRCEAHIDNDYGLEGPAGISGLGVDDFSVRWTARPTLEEGTYAFTATADDGVRVRVDGELVLDEWRDQGATDFAAQRALTAGAHDVVVEYYERGAGALARFGYSRTSTPPAPPAAPTGLAASAGDGVVELTWQPVTGDVAGYRVYRSTSLPVPTTVAPLGGEALLSTPAYTDRAVQNGTGYSYVVVAVSGSGAASAASAPASATPTAPAPFSLALNFQPDAAPVPSGFVKETGQAYTSARGYGWVRQDSLSGAHVPLDLTRNTRDRNRSGIAQELDTMIHAQYGDILPAGTNGNLAPGAFEAAVLNGTYTVSVSVGDEPGTQSKTAAQFPPSGCTVPCYDSWHTLRAEGISLLDRFAGSAAQEYRTVTGQITVTDGVLTLDAIGGNNTKLNWLRVERSAPDTVAPAAPTALTGTAGDAQVALSWTRSVSIDAVGYRVHRSASSPVDLSTAPISGPSLLTGTSFTDTTAANGTTYHYAVLAVDGAGNVSGPSNEATATPQELQGLSLKVNFSDAETAPPAGHVRDFGEPYGARSGPSQGTGLTYGWVAPGTSTPLSLVGNGRLRTSGLSLRENTLMHMQYGDVQGGTSGVPAPGSWEVAVPDGLYEVTVSAGDQAGANDVFDSTHVLNVERAVGNRALRRQQPAAALRRDRSGARRGRPAHDRPGRGRQHEDQLRRDHPARRPAGRDVGPGRQPRQGRRRQRRRLGVHQRPWCIRRRRPDEPRGQCEAVQHRHRCGGARYLRLIGRQRRDRLRAQCAAGTGDQVPLRRDQRGGVGGRHAVRALHQRLHHRRRRGDRPRRVHARHGRLVPEGRADHRTREVLRLDGVRPRRQALRHHDRAGHLPLRRRRQR